MWIRKRIDIRRRDLIWSAWQCLVAKGSPHQYQQRLESCWPERDPVLALSVRTGFDALLSSVDWDHNDEVIFSGLTISDMPRIARHHGFKVVAADICHASLAPDVSEISRLISKRTRAVVIAHLFGTRAELDAIAELAQQRGILLIEDCAQAWVGGSWTGHHRATVSMFSFGPIKTNTALGGAVLQIRSPELRQRISKRLDQLPPQSNRSFLRRIIKYAGLLFLSNRYVYGMSYRCLRRFGVDFDRRVSALARGFRSIDFFSSIRQRMSPAQTQLLIRRLTRFDESEIKRRVKTAIALRNLLGDQVDVLGPDCVKPGVMLEANTNSYWVFAIMSPNRDRLRKSLVEAGFDATHRCSMRPVIESCSSTLPGVTSIEQNVLFIPVEQGMDDADLGTMADLIRNA